MVQAGFGHAVRQIMNPNKPQIDIALTGQDTASTSYIRSYSTLDRIEGVATIQAKSNVNFNALDINLLGVTRSEVDKMTTISTMHGRTSATHRFLKLSMPLGPNDLPPNNRLQAGQSYKIPFTFVVPSHLLPKACAHQCANSHVKEAHLCLPPSMGDPDISGFGSHLLDDLCPSMLKIGYFIRVQLTSLRDDGSVNLITEESKKLRIKPAFEELPPISVDVKDDEYRLREQKTIRKGLVAGKLGKLTVEAAQPSSFRLPPLTPGCPLLPVTTSVRIKLRFDPHGPDKEPPQLGTLTSKLKVSTFFSSGPRAEFPRRATAVPDLSQNYIAESLPLSSMCVSNTNWTQHARGSGEDLERRTSTVSAESNTSSSTASAKNKAAVSTTLASVPHFYTASLLIPLALPTSKNLLPTFHTCIASRVYGLIITLSLKNTSILSSSATLKLPVQISSVGSSASAERIAQAEAEAQALLEAEDVFAPRTRSVALGSILEFGDEPPVYGGVEFHGGGGFGRRANAGVAVF